MAPVAALSELDNFDGLVDAVDQAVPRQGRVTDATSSTKSGGLPCSSME